MQAKIEDLKSEFALGVNYYILYVEDETELHDIFIHTLDSYGIKVQTVKNANECLDLIRKRSSDILMIFSDIKMPGMDGFQLRQEVLKIAPNIPFCIISAFVDKEMALRGLDLKIVGFLNKPFVTEEIVHLLHKEALPRSQSLREDEELRLSFISDSEELIEESEEILLKLEQDSSNSEALNRFYAIMHTLKGSSAFFEFKDLHRFTHAYEDVLKKLQRNEIRFTPEVSTALFKGFDVIKLLFSEFKTGQHSERNFDDLLKIISPSTYTQKEEQNTPLESSNKVSQTDQAQGRTPQKSRGAEDIKVSIKLLDEFMQLSGEVTVIRNMLNKCVSSIERKFAGDRDVGMLTELLGELHKINSSVQNKMTEIRKVPLKSVYKVLPRAVRDVAKSLNKKVNLEIKGEDLRVDTSIVEVLNNSLLHIIKNSLDHGLESPADRAKSGKQETGRIEVDAHVRDDKVIVKISDDGRGLNLDAIKAKLIKNGTHTKAQTESMSVPELYAMIFSSGFSTAQNVTEISGRGVGMSMVKDSVDSIGGQILIHSDPGKGASFQLELPIPKSVLIASCLGVYIGKRKFALIQDDILRVVQYDPKQCAKHIQDLEKSSYLLHEGELVPIVDLSRILNLNHPVTDSSGNRRLVVMKPGQSERKIAVEVTEVQDAEDMVIKNIHSTLNSKSLYRGVTFLDDGGVGLILNTSGILNCLHISEEANSKAKKHAEKSEEQEKMKLQKILKQALTVKINGQKNFAIPQEKVFRIEEIKSNLIKQSGHSKVIPYREKTLQLVSLGQIVSNKKTEANLTFKDEQATKKVVVIRGEKSLLGLEVEDVLDMVTYEELKKELAQKQLHIDGHFFLGDDTFALLNVDSIQEGTKAA